MGIYALLLRRLRGKCTPFGSAVIDGRGVELLVWVGWMGLDVLMVLGAGRGGDIQGRRVRPIVETLRQHLRAYALLCRYHAYMLIE